MRGAGVGEGEGVGDGVGVWAKVFRGMLDAATLAIPSAGSVLTKLRRSTFVFSWWTTDRNLRRRRRRIRV
jgi:hypothetical protein